MSIRNTESKEMIIAKLVKEIKHAKDQVWDLMLFGASIEEIGNCQGYIKFLENEKKQLERL